MKKKFIKFCKKNKFEQNINQIEIISDLVKFFFQKRFSLISSLKKFKIMLLLIWKCWGW